MSATLMKRMLTEPDKRLLWKFVYNFGFKGMRSIEKFQKRLQRGEYFPAFLFLSVTNACNLACQGCWVSQSNPPRQIAPGTLDNVITECKAQGSCFFGILGGEPLLYDGLFEVFEKHPDCYFLLFTNGTLITDAVAKEMRRIGNISPLISIEGLEKVSDERRGGKNVYEQTLAGLANCRANRLVTGVCTSVCKSNIADLATVVSKLLEGGKVDAVVGVSCLNALEKSFPQMADDAIPGLAIPLTADGCVGTKMDLDHVREAIQLKSSTPWKNTLDTERLHQVVDGWFADSGAWKTETRTAQIAYDWLRKDGKRWRPYLLACTYSALNDGTTDLPDEVRRLAIAVECFHKASLIHDDIEDNDDLRYGRPTFHRQYGVPVAINAGDLLVGEGYRWITTVETRTAELLRIAAENHRTLCLGQGEELYGLAHGNPFAAKEIIEIFRRKTAPAFSVSLLLGAVAAGADRELLETLQSFSESLGIAYQIHDDLEEYKSGEAIDLRASILLALANEAHPGGGMPPFEELMVVEKAEQLLEHYKNEAVRALNPVRNALLKSLLRRIAAKMLSGR